MCSYSNITPNNNTVLENLLCTGALWRLVFEITLWRWWYDYSHFTIKKKKKTKKAYDICPRSNSSVMLDPGFLPRQWEPKAPPHSAQESCIPRSVRPLASCNRSKKSFASPRRHCSPNSKYKKLRLSISCYEGSIIKFIT